MRAIDSTPPPWLHFIQRPFPSANMVIIEGRHPVLFDSGFGSDFAETERLLRDAGVPPDRLSFVLNSHYHSDHVGGNFGLQTRYGVHVAAHRWEAAMINRRDPEACSATWLDQPVEPYTVNRPLSDGDEIPAGDTILHVLHTPGHTLGHISLYLPEEQILLCGDAIHRDDVPWISIYREGAGALERAIESLERLARLPIRWACSGHGPAIENPTAAIETGLSRYERWLTQPENMGWHACKRVFTYALMLTDGMAAADIPAYLTRCGWYCDVALGVFHAEPVDFVAPLLAEMVRSGAAMWRDGRLIPAVPYVAPPPDWAAGIPQPADWPPANQDTIRRVGSSSGAPGT